ncbi:MAG: DUF1059 domain-containing protein [Patescibacteria group bacterium]
MDANNQRKSVDCRKMPSENNCDIYMTGSEEHLLEAATAHAVKSHGHDDTPELRSQIRSAMEPEK